MIDYLVCRQILLTANNVGLYKLPVSKITVNTSACVRNFVNSLNGKTDKIRGLLFIFPAQ